MNTRPDILPVVEQHVALRRAGKQFMGRCPFHGEKTPSFMVNADKGLFYCHGCSEGGDVFSFVMLIEKIDFKTAIKRLGIENYRPKPEQIRRRTEARRIAEWARDISLKLRDRLLQIGNRAHMCRKVQKLASADQVVLGQEEQSLRRQWEILCDLDDDLQNPAIVVEACGNRAEIDNFVEAL